MLSFNTDFVTPSMGTINVWFTPHLGRCYCHYRVPHP